MQGPFNENNIARFFVYFIAFFFYLLRKENNSSTEDFTNNLFLFSTFLQHFWFAFCLDSLEVLTLCHLALASPAARRFFVMEARAPSLISEELYSARQAFYGPGLAPASGDTTKCTAPRTLGTDLSV